MARLAALVDRVFDDLAHPGEHQVPERDTLEHLAPLPVDDLALLVHDIVVLDEIAAGGAGLGLRPRLCPLRLFWFPPRLHRPLHRDPRAGYSLFFLVAPPQGPP